MRYSIQRTILPLAAIALGLCACRKSEIHPDDHGLGVSSYYEDNTDNAETANDIKLFIFNSTSGDLVTKASWDDTRRLADTLFRVGPGDYTLVAAADLVSPFAVSSEAKADEIRLTVEGIPDFHAYFGAAQITVTDASVITRTDIYFRRMLSELVIEFDGFPQGVKADAVEINGAEYILPAGKDPDNRFGLPSADYKDIALKQMTIFSDTQESSIFRLPPTAHGYSASLFRITLTHPDGHITVCEVEAPRMEIAGKYRMMLKYSEMKSYIRLSPFEINGWTEGWCYSGTVTDPD